MCFSIFLMEKDDYFIVAQQLDSSKQALDWEGHVR